MRKGRCGAAGLEKAAPLDLESSYLANYSIWTRRAKPAPLTGGDILKPYTFRKSFLSILDKFGWARGFQCLRLGACHLMSRRL